MNRLYFLSLLLILADNKSFAQDAADTVKTGLLHSTPEQIASGRLLGSSTISEEIKDPLKRKDLSIYLPVIEDQGISESCSAFAVASATSILINYKNKRTFIPLRNYPPEYYDYYNSPSYIFNLSKAKYPETLRGNCGYGISYPDAFTIAMNKGTVTWNKYPYFSSTCKCEEDPDKIILSEPTEKLFIYQPVNINSKLFVSLLSQDQAIPICIGANLDRNYVLAGRHENSNCWKTRGAPLPQTNSYHAMVIVGFDEDLRVFKVADSKGNQWGDKGYIYISFDLVDDPSKPIDAAYMPLLNNKMLDLQATTVNGTGSIAARYSNDARRWKLGENRFSVMEYIRVIYLGKGSKDNIVNFQFKNSETGALEGEQLVYPLELGKTSEINIKPYTIKIHPLRVKKGVVTFDIQVDYSR